MLRVCQILYFADGAGELLDAWLMLIEKLTNHRTLLDSPHILPNQSTAPRFVPFDPHKFVASTQKVCFNEIFINYFFYQQKLALGVVSDVHVDM